MQHSTVLILDSLQSSSNLFFNSTHRKDLCRIYISILRFLRCISLSILQPAILMYFKYFKAQSSSQTVSLKSSQISPLKSDIPYLIHLCAQLQLQNSHQMLVPIIKLNKWFAQIPFHAKKSLQDEVCRCLGLWNFVLLDILGHAGDNGIIVRLAACQWTT